MEISNLKFEYDVRKPIVQVEDEFEDLEIVKVYHGMSRLKNPLKGFSHGEEFLEFLEYMEANKNNPEELPLLVLVDINMPEMDGFEILEALRAMPEFAETPPCIMLTSSTRDEDRDAASKSGANDYLVKPGDAKSYIDLFNSIADNAK